MKIVFDLPASRLAEAQALVERFGRKAAKLGMAAPSLLVTHEYLRSWVVHRDGGIVSGPFDAHVPFDTHALRAASLHVQALAMVRVEVTGERPVIAGWEFCAVLEHTDAGNIMSKVPGCPHELPTEYRTCGPRWCDHCKTDRKRTNTYVLRSTETGEFQRVGRSCLQTFLADASPAAWMSGLTFERQIRELSEYDDGLGGFGASCPIVTPPTFIAGVIALARMDGYVSAAEARDRFGVTCTGDTAHLVLTHSRPDVRRDLLDAITPKEYALAADALEWIASDAAGDSDYIHNLRIAVQLPTVTSKHCRLIASLVPTFRKDLARRAIKAAAVNEYLDAEIGERPVLDVTIEKINFFDNAYGRTYFVKMRSTCGRLAEWKTSSPYTASGEDFNVGESFRVVGTVKEQTEYKGALATRLSVCKLHPAGSDAKTLATAMRKFCKLHGTDAPMWAWTDAQKRSSAKRARAAQAQKKAAKKRAAKKAVAA